MCDYSSGAARDIQGGVPRVRIIIHRAYYSNSCLRLHEDGNPVGGFWMGKTTFEYDDYYTPDVFIDYFDGRIGFDVDISMP